jgi:hypothetical protein
VAGHSKPNNNNKQSVENGWKNWRSISSDAWKTEKFESTHLPLPIAIVST